MSMLKPFRRLVLACAAVLAMSGMAKATNFVISQPPFGPISGTQFTYNGSERDTFTADPGAQNWLFGTPVLSAGNSLDFPPDSSQTPRPNMFSVVIPGGEQHEDGTLTVNMGLAPQNSSGSIALLSISEGGGYFLSPISASSMSSASAALNIQFLKVTAVNGAAVTPFVVPFTESFQRDNNPAIPGNLISITGTTAAQSGLWSGLANFNIAGALAQNGFANQRATGLQLVLDNILDVTAPAGASASIDKKDFLISTSSFVPEPSSIIMGVLGGLGLGLVGYRKKFAKTA